MILILTRSCAVDQNLELGICFTGFATPLYQKWHQMSQQLHGVFMVDVEPINR